MPASRKRRRRKSPMVMVERAVVVVTLISQVVTEQLSGLLWRSTSRVELPAGSGALEVAGVGVAVERGDGARQVADLRHDIHDGAHAGDVQLAVARQRLR